MLPNEKLSKNPKNTVYSAGIKKKILVYQQLRFFRNNYLIIHQNSQTFILNILIEKMFSASNGEFE